MKWFIGMSLFVAVFTVRANSDVPNYTKLRQDEDWSAWCNAGHPGFEYKCLRPWQDSLLSLGGEIRARYENTADPTWGDDPQDKHGVVMQRYVLFADFKPVRNLRLFGQINSALESGRADGPSPVDENKLSVQQGFLQWQTSPKSRLTVGRQELNFGSGRLVDVREGPNVRRRFDAIQWQLAIAHWRIDVVAARPWVLHSGAFDDHLDQQQALWGIYSVGKDLGFGLDENNLDLYYLGYRNEQAVFMQGKDDELRHSVGARFWGNDGAWHWDWEFIYQFGHFGAGDIRAWSIASNTRRDLPYGNSPAIGISTNIASGDKDPTSAQLGAFNAIFPRGNYFSELALLGPRNFFNLHPYVSFSPSSALALTFEVDFYWRLSSDDGVYGPAGQLLRAAQNTNGHYVATEASVNATWSLTRNIEITAIYGHSFPGPVIRDSAPSKGTDFLELTLKYQY